MSMLLEGTGNARYVEDYYGDTYVPDDDEIAIYDRIKAIVCADRELKDNQMVDQPFDLTKQVKQEEYFSFEQALELIVGSEKDVVEKVNNPEISFNDFPPEIIQSILENLPDRELYRMGLANLRIYHIAKEIMPFRREKMSIKLHCFLQKNLSNVFSNGYNSRCKKSEKFMEIAKTLPSGSDERKEMLRKAILCLPDYTDSLALKHLLYMFPYLYEDNVLLEELFKHFGSRVFYHLSNYPRYNSKYAFAYFDAWKKGIIRPNRVWLNLADPVSQKFISYLQDAISHNKTVKKLILTLREIGDPESLRGVFQSIKDNPVIEEICIFTSKASHNITWGEKYRLDYQCEMMKRPDDSPNAIVAVGLLKDFGSLVGNFFDCSKKVDI